MKRRIFIKTSAALGATVFTELPFRLLAGNSAKRASDVVPIGNTGIKASRLAVGTGSNGWGGSSNQTRQLGIKGMSHLLEAAFDNGVNFWDSADQYGSHPHLKAGLQNIPREKVVILTKTHASTAAAMEKDLDRFRKEIGTDYIDILLLHCMTDGKWPEQRKGAMEVLSRAREDGIIKAHGVSCHTMAALRAAEQSDWVQIDLARINPDGVRMDGAVSEVVPVLKNMKKQGKAVMGMKILGDGRLAHKRTECLRFALAQSYLDCFTIGIENMEQLNDLIRRIPEASAQG